MGSLEAGDTSAVTVLETEIAAGGLEDSSLSLTLTLTSKHFRVSSHVRQKQQIVMGVSFSWGGRGGGQGLGVENDGNSIPKFSPLFNSDVIVGQDMS